MTLTLLTVLNILFCFFLTEVDPRPVNEQSYDSAIVRLPRRTKRYLTNSDYPRNSQHKRTLSSSQKYLKDVYIFKDLFKPRGNSNVEDSSGRTFAQIERKLQLRLRLKLQNFDTEQTQNLPRWCGGVLGDSKTRSAAGAVKSIGELAKRLRVKVRRRRVRRFVTQGSKWSHRTLTWTVKPGDESTKMTASQVKNTLQMAFRTWAEVSPLVFRWTSSVSNADIVIRFATGYHGDSENFDGAGGKLAHAFYPQYGGDIHFDDDEPWTPTTSDATHKSLQLVATHEIGHSLGLGHTNQAGAIMNPTYGMVGSSLGEDDIKGINDIYDYCSPDRIDAIESYMHNGLTYVFKGSDYWRLDDPKNRSALGYPRAASAWYGVPNDIDDAFLWGHNWQFYFFKGPNYYRYNGVNDAVDSGYPLPISSGWPGLPATGIDAAFTYSDYVSYFFKGEWCYKFDNTLDAVAAGYPKKISDVWPGVPNDLDTVFRWYYNGKTYFFKGQDYWEWNPTSYRAMGPFPISIGWKNLCNV